MQEIGAVTPEESDLGFEFELQVGLLYPLRPIRRLKVHPPSVLQSIIRVRMLKSRSERKTAYFFPAHLL